MNILLIQNSPERNQNGKQLTDYFISLLPARADSKFSKPGKERLYWDPKVNEARGNPKHYLTDIFAPSLLQHPLEAYLGSCRTNY